MEQKTNNEPTLEIMPRERERESLQQLQMRADAEFQLTKVGQELRRFEILQRMGQLYASATIVPDTYKGNLANCAIAIDMAQRMNANPVMVMQNLYLVHGMPAWSSKFLIATINTCGRFTPLRYECNGKEGDDYGWRCVAFETADTERKHPLEGTWVTRSMVKAEGWNKKPGSKWLTMPEQMFRYRAAAFWQRMYAPEISMGFSTADEIEDIQVVDVVAEEIGAEANKGAQIGRKAPSQASQASQAQPQAATQAAQPAAQAQPQAAAAPNPGKPKMDF